MKNKEFVFPPYRKGRNNFFLAENKEIIFPLLQKKDIIFNPYRIQGN